MGDAYCSSLDSPEVGPCSISLLLRMVYAIENLPTIDRVDNSNRLDMVHETIKT